MSKACYVEIRANEHAEIESWAKNYQSGKSRGVNDLVRKIMDNPGFQDYVFPEAIVNILKLWKSEPDLGKHCTFIEFLLDNINSGIQTHTYIFPLNQTMIDSRQRLFSVELSSLKEVYENSFERPEGDFLKRYSKNCAISLQIVGEQYFAHERAILTAKSIARSLRFCMEESYSLESPNRCDLIRYWGNEGLVFAAKNSYLEYESMISNVMQYHLGTDSLTRMQQEGLGKVFQSLSNQFDSEYQNSLKDSLAKFCDSALISTSAHRVHDVVSSVDMLLGRSTTQSFAEFMAYLTADTYEERISALNRAKSAYSIRSNYTHKNKSSDRNDDLELFLRDVQRLFLYLIDKSPEIRSLEQLNAHYETIKYS